MDHNQSEFLTEIEETVENVFADLDELRATRTDGRIRRELIDRIFRHVHSIKGSAATYGLEVVSQIAHELESLLDEVRGGRVLIDTEMIDACESATEALLESLSLAAAGVVEPSRRALFARLQAAAQNRAVAIGAEDREAILASIPDEIRQSLTEPEKQRAVNIAAQGAPLFIVSATFEINTFDEEFSRLRASLSEFGEVISTSPAIDDEHPEKIIFRVLYASETDPKTIEAASRPLPHVRFTEILDRRAGSGESASLSSTHSSAPLLTKSVRTDLDKLDRLISSTHELLRTTSTALELAISQPATASEKLAQLNEQIRSSFIGLEDELINLRMMSLGPTLQRAARAGKAAARSAAKEIDFEISGGDIRLDKLLVEALVDPLIHLVRNAVDHGIETGAEREAAGKKPRGTVRIVVLSEGSQTRLRVIDDGRGVDPMAISEAALRLGITHEPGLDIERSLRLIFRPGFTTVSSASGISGRGVGLDIVETGIEQVGGELRVSSSLGRGTTFEIRLPVTFGVVAANVVVSAGHRYCIPANQTLGIEAIDVIDGTSAADQLRQVSMRDLLGQPEASDDDSSQLHLITCQFTDERAGINSQETKSVGIVVDRVEGPQEVLVRNLGRHAGRWYGIAGATELRDGTVALVLDLPRLLSGPHS
ncbi:MAG TPA: ATP-binding protein [Pyrinomonadaceae bacterium]|nr:ATP-binding protein [Pyrinomonadaceae bacterium]